MANLKGTKTEANLLAAFAGESQARNKYVFYAAKASAEGYYNAAAVFEANAKNEEEHAKMWFKYLKDGIPGTIENLKDAAAGEAYEADDMYKKFAADAKAEGFDKLATLFANVGVIEKAHEAEYNALINGMGDKPDAPASTWRCLKCGYVYEGATAPDTCTVCDNKKTESYGLFYNYDPLARLEKFVKV